MTFVTTFDAGLTWSVPAVANTNPLQGIRYHGAEYSNGEWFIAFITLMDTVGGIAVEADGDIALMSSTDFGATWGTPRWLILDKRRVIIQVSNLLA